MDQAGPSPMLIQPGRQPCQQRVRLAQGPARPGSQKQLGTQAPFRKERAPAGQPAVGLGAGADEVVLLPAEATVAAGQAAAMQVRQGRPEAPPGLGRGHRVGGARRSGEGRNSPGSTP